MPKTTASVGLGSSDLTSNPLSLSARFSLTTDGTAGLEETTGLTRIKVGTSATTIADESEDFTNSGESQLAYIYLKNFSTNATTPVFTDSLIIKVSDGSNHLTLGHLAGGQACLLPYSANNDITITADTADTIVEYIIVHEG